MRIEIVGKISDHQWGTIYGGGGVSPTLTKCDYKEPVKIMVSKMRWPCGNNDGFMECGGGDGIVIRRPHQVRKSVMKDNSFAICRSTGNMGVCVVDDARILKRQRSEYGKQIRKKYEAGQMDAQWNDIKEYVPSEEPFSNTISTVVKDNMVAFGEKVPIENEDDVVSCHTPGRMVKRQNGSESKNDGTSFTVTSADKDGIAQISEQKLRIRYLTPRECLRLQAFPDDIIDKLEQVLGKTALYEVAGNSIAVCCLKAIFKGIYIDKTFRKDKQSNLGKFF